MNFPLLKKSLDLSCAAKWLIEDAKDDFFPDALGFREIKHLETEYLSQREHRIFQLHSFPSRTEYVPKSNGMLREAVWLHPIHRLQYLAILHYLIPRIDGHLSKDVYSYRLDASDPQSHPFAKTIDRWKAYHNDFRAACLDNDTNAVLLADISSFYDHISVEKLCFKLEAILGTSIQDSDNEVIGFLKNLLQSCSMTGYGIPQNYDPSSFFGSMYLHLVDREMEASRFNYFRWVDDIKICAKNRAQALRALHKLQQELAKERLFLASDKTKIILKGTTEFDQLVRVEDDLLISETEEALARGQRSEIEAKVQICLERFRFHATDQGDDRKIRAFANRLLQCAAFPELRQQIEPVINELIAPRLVSHVSRTEDWLKMLNEASSSTAFTYTAQLLINEKSVFDWQRFHLWRFLTCIECSIPRLNEYLDAAKSVATSHVSELEASQAILFLGRRGSNEDRESLFTAYFTPQRSYVIQRSVLIAIQEMSPVEHRNRLYDKAIELNSEHAQLIAFLKAQEKPVYGGKKRQERAFRPSPPPLSILMKRGVGMVNGAKTAFRLSRSDFDYE